MSSRLKDRFNQAVHRRISMRKGRESEVSYEEKIYDGPWSDANAKYLHSRGTITKVQDLEQDDVPKYAMAIRATSMIMLRQHAERSNDDKTIKNLTKKISKLLSGDQKKYEALWYSIDAYAHREDGKNVKKRLLDLIKDSTRQAKNFLNNYKRCNNNRLTRMNGRKPKKTL